MSDHPWFVRRRRPGKLQLNPASPAGWALTLGYIVLVTGASLVVPLQRGTAGVVAFVVVALLLTAAFVTIAWRTSVPEAEWQRRKG